MTTNFVRWVCCDECGGCGRIPLLLKGAGILDMGGQSCWKCYGFGEIRQRMTRDEVLAALEETEKQTTA